MTETCHLRQSAGNEETISFDSCFQPYTKFMINIQEEYIYLIICDIKLSLLTYFYH